MSEPTSEATGHDKPGLVRQRPPTRRDLRVASLSITSAGIPLAIIGTRFFMHENDGVRGMQDLNAAIMFWFGAALLIVVGTAIRISASRMKQDPAGS
jgi:hypothetical protein